MTQDELAIFSCSLHCIPEPIQTSNKDSWKLWSEINDSFLFLLLGVTDGNIFI